MPAPWAPALFVWGIWTALVVAGVAFIACYHTAIPFGEDWDHMIPWIAGAVPVNLHELWKPLELYRPFLLRLVLRGLLWLSGGYYWSLAAFHLVCLGGLSFAMIRESARRRGWTTYADAFFPFALLPWAFAFHVYLGETIGQLLPTVVAGPVLLVIVRRGTELTPKAALLAGVCLVLLPLCSVYGMVYQPALLAWFVYCGVVAWRAGSAQGRKTAWVIAGLAVAALTLFGLYLVGISSNRGGSGASLEDKLWASWGMLTLSWGVAGGAWWPFSGYLTALVAGLSVAAAVVGLWGRPRPNCPLGLLLFLGGVVTMVLAYGWGRAAPDVENPVVFYYGSLPVLVLCCLFFIWGGRPYRDAGHLAQICLFTGMAMACSLNLYEELGDEGFYWNTKRYWNEQRAFEQDIRDGVPPYRILARHGNTVVGLSNSDAALLDGAMHQLHRAHFGLFRAMEEDPVLREVPLAVDVIERQGAAWENGTGRVTEPDGYVTLSLGKPTYVAGLRVRVAYADDPANSAFDEPRVAWKAGGADYPVTPQYARRPAYRDEGKPGITVYVADTVDQVRLYFSQGRDFHITEVVLLTPVEAAPAGP